jgi:hypothetical protein
MAVLAEVGACVVSGVAAIALVSGSTLLLALQLLKLSLWVLLTSSALLL